MKCPIPPPLSFQIVPFPFTGDTNVVVIDPLSFQIVPSPFTGDTNVIVIDPRMAPSCEDAGR
jgi:hypothetical protein